LRWPGTAEMAWCRDGDGGLDGKDGLVKEAREIRGSVMPHLNMA
jgi:hypothetical protein